MKILVAEDDPNMREGLADLLASEGYDVIVARDGLEARARFEAEAPDLAMLDIMMPGLDGYSLCRELTRRHPEVPIIFVSAKGEEIDRVIGLELGADDYITKPFGVREIVARVRAVTRRTLARRSDEGTSDEGPFAIGDLVVSPAELRARRGEECIDLSLREVRILQLLAREKGRVVTREAFFRECWGLQYLPNSRTLDQHVSKLRRRIEKDPQEPTIIRTVHGVGYRYDGD